MADSITLKLFQNTQALGNVRPLAAQTKQTDGKDPTKTVAAAQASSAAHAQLQDQVDKLIQRMKTQITITAADIAPLIPPSSTSGVISFTNY